MFIRIAILTGLLASTAWAQEARYHFDISNLTLSQALRNYGQISGQEVIFTEDVVAGLKSISLKGDYTAQAALERLLQGTGLIAQRSSSGAVMIRRSESAGALASKQGDDPDPPGDSSTDKEGKKSSSDGFRVAQVDQGQASGPSSLEKQDNSSRQKKEKSQNEQLEEVVVTGTHIPGQAPIGSEMITIDRAQIEQSGFGRISEVLAQVPQNFSPNNDNSGLGIGVGDAQNQNRGTEIQLRGLGIGTTLVLVNGHRQPSGGFLGAFTDISSIPTAAVDHIEILPDGASAIYGSDAIGGVVNFVLRNDYDGAETQARYGSADGSAGQLDVSQILGKDWSGGHVLVGYQYEKRDELEAIDRPYSAANMDYRPFGGSDLRTFFGNPGTILDSSGQPAYAIPKGQDGTHLTASELIPGGINYTDTVTDNWLLPREVSNSVFFDVGQSISDSLKVSADLQYGARSIDQESGPAATRTLRVPSTNPFYVNPFGGTGPVRVAYNFGPDLGPALDKGNTNVLTSSAGAQIALPKAWTLNVSGGFGYEDDTDTSYNRTMSSLYKPALADSNPATALNVFGDGSHTNPATLAALKVTQTFGAHSQEWSTSVVAEGPVVQLPGGSSRLAVGAEYRNDQSSSTILGVSGMVSEAARGDTAAFGELTLPLVGSDNTVPGVRKLDVSLAGRFDHYSDFGNTTNPKVGLSWRPLDDLTVRGTWGTSFRAPPFYLYATSFNTSGGGTAVVADPKNPTGFSTIAYVFGNNPNLRPETATTWSSGIDYSPKSLTPLHLAVTYFNIDYIDKIGFIDLTNSLAQENLYGPAIVRNPSAAQLSLVCNTPNFVGDCTVPIAAIVDSRSRNLAVVKEDGIDLLLAYSIDSAAGTWGATDQASYVFHYDQALTTLAPPVDVINTAGQPLKFRNLFTFSWKRGSWSAHSAVHFDNAYKDVNFTPARTVDSWTRVDLGVAYQIVKRATLLDNLRVQASVTNVFNEQPPFVNQQGGYDAANASLIGRTYSVQLVKPW